MAVFDRVRLVEKLRHLVPVSRRGIATEQCPSGHGVWAKPDDLYEIPARERDSWFARRYPYRPR